MSSSVLGEILERPKSKSPGSGNIQEFKTNVRTGFPVAQHRSQSQSAFAKARLQQLKPQESKRGTAVPVVASGSGIASNPTPKSIPLRTISKDEEWRQQMQEQNAAMVDQMSDNEIEQEQQELMERYGPDLLKKLASLRDKQKKPPEAQKASMKPPPLSNIPNAALSRPTSPGAASPSSPRAGILSIPGTPRKKPGKLRFSDNPAEVFVYESQPPSPKRVLGLLAPRNTETENSESGENIPVIPVVQLKFQKPTPPPTEDRSSTEDVKMASPTKNESGDLEEFTTDAIRKRFFPAESEQNPALEWTQPSSSTSITPVGELPLRYDLKGNPVPPSKVQSLPSHLGLHHHAASDQAGYTLDDLLLLCRSTMAAQRAAMLGVLSKLLRRLKEPKDVNEKENVDDIRRKAVIVGLEAFGERSGGASISVRLRGLDVLWEGIVGWEEKSSSSEPVSELMNAVPASYLLPAVEYNFSRSSGILSASSMVQVLEILKALVEMTGSNIDIASAVVLCEPEDVSPPGLLDTIVKGTLSTQRFGDDAAMETDSTTSLSNSTGALIVDDAVVALIQLLQACAKRSRTCALGIRQATEALLRYLVVLPSSWPRLSELDDTESPIKSQIGIRIVTELLNLYILLGQYGAYVGALSIVGRDSFQKLSKYLQENLSSSSSTSTLSGLTTAYLRLIEIWIICATDPHCTTPEHDILWSQVAGWGSWNEAIQFGKDNPLVWGITAAWIEGCVVNGVAGGKRELDVVEEELRDGWLGDEPTLLWRLQDAIQRIVDSSSSATDLTTISYGLRLLGSLGARRDKWLQLIGSSELEELLQAIVDQHDTWSQLSWDSKRVWTSILGSALHLLGLSSNDTTTAYCQLATKVLQVLLPGDESIAYAAIESLLQHVVDKPIQGLPDVIWSTSTGSPSKILKPFYRYALWPNSDSHYLPPFIVTPQSIKASITLIPNSQSNATNQTPSGGLIGLRLPLQYGDWPFVPLDILLRSGTAEGRFIKSLPMDWDADETEVVRATLTFMHQLLDSGVVECCLEEVVFGCMKVYMLEHGQGGVEGKEVFGDGVVELLLGQLLTQFKYSNLSNKRSPESRRTITLETVAQRFLGESQPFYQFYSDFLGLYDSISFANPLFGALLLPATSLRYPKDFRRLFWGDYPWIIRALDAAVPLKDLLLNDRNQLSDWLWSWENDVLQFEDGEMIGHYLKALITLGGTADGILSFAATHQVASAIWPDMRPSGDSKKEATAVNLLKALMANCRGEDGEGVVRKVLWYHQIVHTEVKGGNEVLVPPQCYQRSNDLVERRTEWAVGAVGEHIRARLIIS